MAEKQLCRFWLSLMLVLALLLTPAAALAEEEAQQPAESETEQQGTPILDDLGWTKLYLQQYALYELDTQVIKNATDTERLITLLKEIDPWAAYYDAEAFEAVQTQYEGEFVGIGVYLGLDESGQVIVKGTIAGSSAEKWGLQYGDIIVSVDGQDTRNLTLPELQQVLQGEAFDLLKIRIERNGEFFEDTISRNRFEEPSIQYWLPEPGIGYLAIDHFTSYTGKQVREAIQSLQKRGMEALVLDLRDCPGGLISTAVDVSGDLIGAGPMLFYVTKEGWTGFYPANEVKLYEQPLVVLINENTASAAELLAANIQDAGRGPVIGVPSYGKGVVQQMAGLPSGAGVTFTIAKYISRGYQDIQTLAGVLPDQYLAGAEAQLAAAVANLKQQLAAPRSLVFPVDRKGYNLGLGFVETAAGALVREGSSYLPLLLALEKLGWQLTEQEGLYYAQHGANRLIVNPATQQLLYGGQVFPLFAQEGVLYLQAVTLRELGYQIIWQTAQRSVEIGF